MRKHEWEQANTALVSAIIAVFDERASRVAHTGRLVDLPDGGMTVAMIGFAGETIRGMLALSLPQSLVVRTCPVETTAYDDWRCELANLVVARFKSALLKLGVTVHLGTPMLASGDNLCLETMAVSAVVHRFESTEHETLYVVLDAVAEPLTHLQPSEETSVAAAGDVVLF